MEERPAHLNDRSRYVLLLPAILIVLLLSVFPLLLSIYTSLSRIKFVKGGFEVTYIGTKNYKKLLEGSGQRRFLGRVDDPTTLGLDRPFYFSRRDIYWLFRYLTGSHRQKLVFALRAITIIIAGRLLWLDITTGLSVPLAVMLLLAVAGVAAYFTGPRQRLFGFVMRVLTIIIAGRTPVAGASNS